MKNIKLVILPLIIVFSCALTSHSQTVVTNPLYPTDIDSCTVIFDATKGSAGLKDIPPPIYAHTGVITNLSTSSTDWKYVIADWNENTAKATMTPLGNNLYQLKIKPSIRSWYGVPVGEKILKLAFVFRNSDGSKTGKESNQGDIFADVYLPVTSVNILQPFNKSLFLMLNAPIPVKATSPLAKTMKIFVNNNLRKTITGTTITDTIPADNFGNNWIKQWVKIIAVNDTASAADSFCYTVIPPPVIAPLPQGIVDGINYPDSTKAILSLYAPGKSNCFLIGDFNDWQVDSLFYMNITPDSKRYWIGINNLEPRKEYLFQYLIDGNVRIADPYCDKVSDPDDQYIEPATYPGLLPYPYGKTTEIASYLQTAQPGYTWNNLPFTPPAVTDLVVYELLIRDFIAKHDYPTLIDTLDYLQRLGINAIELMPVMEFEGNSSWGYNPDFMFAPDKYYGTKNGLKQFIEAAHASGIAVILDIVLNHQFGRSPLVRLYWDGGANTVAADNPWFNQAAKHPANVGFDFNHESPDTKVYCERLLKYWLQEFHVDGFRLDLSKGLTQKYSSDYSSWAQSDSSRIAILKNYQTAVLSVKPDAYMILEHFAGNSEEKELSASGMLLWGNMNDKYNQATMGWTTGGKSDFSWVSYKQRGWTDPHLIGYMESHDEERLMFKNIKSGNSQASYSVKDTTTALKRIEAAAAFFFTVPGPKMILQFEELGYDYTLNLNGDKLAPKPIRWDYQDEWRRRYLFNVFSSLIGLKKNYSVFKSNDYSLNVSQAMKRINLQDPAMNVTIVGNFDIYQGTIDPAFQNTGIWYDFFSGDSINVLNTSDPLTLLPGEYHLYTSVRLKKPVFTGMDEPQTENYNRKVISLVYPNPSSGSFIIEFDMQEPADVNLTVYDMTGRPVGTLIDSYLNKGSHKIIWKGANTNGQQVHSGFYFCKLKIGSYCEMKKLIVE
jgi:glycosidase